MGTLLLRMGFALIIILIFVGLIVYLRRQWIRQQNLRDGLATKGDLNRAQEQTLLALLDSAAVLAKDLRTPVQSLGTDFTILSSKHKHDVDAWLEAYHKKGFPLQ